MARACSLLLVLGVALAALQVASADQAAQQHQLPFEGLVEHSLHGPLRTIVLGVAYFLLKFKVDRSLIIVVSLPLVRGLLRLGGPVLDKMAEFEAPIRELQTLYEHIRAKSPEEVQRKVRLLDTILPMIARCASATLSRLLPGVVPAGFVSGPVSLLVSDGLGNIPIKIATDKLL